MTIPPPSASSIAYRESIARLLTPLRRIRPTVPYYKLAAHRIPTLWTLYRGLQRHAERENLKWRIRTLFEAKRHTIQAHAAKAQLERAYQECIAFWLDVFIRAKQGDTRLRAVLDRYDRMIGSKRERRQFGRLVREALDEQVRIRTRTIFKGSFVRPTFQNKLLPQLVPQPLGISCMIHKRRLNRERRYEHSAQLMEWSKDLQMEIAFERHLRRFGEQFKPAFSDDPDAWLQPLQDKLRIMQKANNRDFERLYLDYPSPLLLRGLRARRQKIGYKTRLYARERAGELFPTTLARMCQGPPAHVLAKMTPEERQADKIVRGPGEAGYTAAVKMSMGRKLKDGKSWKMEDVTDESESLERMEEVIREENQRRRSASMIR